jgi:hypothetical protein
MDYSFMKKIAPKHFTKFAFVPSVGAWGAILMSWNDSMLYGCNTSYYENTKHIVNPLIE